MQEKLLSGLSDFAQRFACMKRLGDSGCEMEMKGLGECPASMGEDRVARVGWIGDQLGWVRGGGLEKLPILVGD